MRKERKFNKSKLIVLMVVIFLFIGCYRDKARDSVNTSPKTSSTQTIKHTNSIKDNLSQQNLFWFSDEKNDEYLIQKEEAFLPRITARREISRYDNSFYELNDTRELMNSLHGIAVEIDTAMNELNQRYENIFVVLKIPFDAYIVYDFKNKTFFWPKYFKDIIHILNTYNTSDEKVLLSNPDSYQYLKLNGFLNYKGDGLETLMNGLNSSYKVIISKGEFNSFSPNDSTRTKYSGESEDVIDVLPSPRKSYSGEGDWFVSIDYDDLDDQPIYNFFQTQSSSLDSANMWLNIRYKNELEVYVSFSTNISLSETATVSYRIDNGSAVINQKWSLSTNRSAVFYPYEEESFIEKLLNGNDLIISVKSRDKEYKATFSLYGLNSTMLPYLDKLEL